jgi:tyrosyl-tRNA synthetase
VMALADNMIIQYFELLTDVTDSELMDFKRQMAGNTTNPMVLKKRLAAELVTQLHGREEALKADENFTNVFQKREMPEEIVEYTYPPGLDIHALDITLPLLETKLVSSRGEAIRLIKQGAIEVDGEKMINRIVAIIKNGSIIKVGKHNFIKVLINVKENK